MTFGHYWLYQAGADKHNGFMETQPLSVKCYIRQKMPTPFIGKILSMRNLGDTA
jgi:hypothetical protein